MIYRGIFIKNYHYCKPTRKLLLFNMEAIKRWMLGEKVETSILDDIPSRDETILNANSRKGSDNLINI